MEAEQALRAARSRILKRISFLSPVLEVVEWREQDGFEGIGTDGRFLLYGKDVYKRQPSSWWLRSRGPSPWL